MSSPQAAATTQEPESSESIPSQGSPLSPEWIHAITNLMGQPLTSEIGQRIQKWILRQAAKSHDVSDILDPTFTPGPSQEEKELFEAKQVFMYKVFNETLLTGMGRTKVKAYQSY